MIDKALDSRRTGGVTIAPSLLAADFARLGDEAVAVEAAGADWLHLDVMDGHFVPNISFGAGVIKPLRPLCGLPFDVHLMIAPVDAYLKDFAEAGADLITVHAEAGPHLHRSLQAIRALGVKAGVAVNPATPIEVVAPVLGDIDLICVMTVNPGFGGQKFITSQLKKIETARRLIDQAGVEVLIEADGGVTADTAPRAIEAGADVLVAGSAVFKAGDYAGAIRALRPGVPATGAAGQDAACGAA